MKADTRLMAHGEKRVDVFVEGHEISILSVLELCDQQDNLVE